MGCTSSKTVVYENKRKSDSHSGGYSHHDEAEHHQVEKKKYKKKRHSRALGHSHSSFFSDLFSSFSGDDDNGLYIQHTEIVQTVVVNQTVTNTTTVVNVN